MSRSWRLMMCTTGRAILGDCAVRWQQAWVAAQHELAEATRERQEARLRAALLELEIAEELAALKASAARRLSPTA